MKHFFLSVISYLKRKQSRHNLFIQYEQKKFELPIYINELALYKFILERQTLTIAERDILIDQHYQRCCKCLKGILELDKLVNALALANKDEAHDYLTKYKEYSRPKLIEKDLLVIKLHEN